MGKTRLFQVTTLPLPRRVNFFESRQVGAHQGGEQLCQPSSQFSQPLNTQETVQVEPFDSHFLDLCQIHIVSSLDN
jgi:hypothetical protein